MTTLFPRQVTAFFDGSPARGNNVILPKEVSGRHKWIAGIFLCCGERFDLKDSLLESSFCVP
jgi:hypothetical protein